MDCGLIYGLALVNRKSAIRIQQSHPNRQSIVNQSSINRQSIPNPPIPNLQ